MNKPSGHKWMFLIALFCLLPALFARPSLAAEQVRVGGTGAGLAAMRQLADVYERSHPGVTVRIMPSLGSSGGIKAVLSGVIDIAISSRPLHEEEQRQGAASVEYARTPLVFATSAKNAPPSLSLDELEKIYAGGLSAWPDSGRIRLILRPENDAMTDDLRRISTGMSQALDAAKKREGLVMAITDQENADVLEKTPGSFGAITLSQALAERRKLTLFSFNGVNALRGRAVNASYPLFRSLFLVTSPKTSAAAKAFAASITGPAGRRVLEQTGNLAVQHKE